MTPEQALTAATRDSANAMGLAETHGKIAVGRRADLLVVDGDPFADLAALRNVRVVYLGGRLVDVAGVTG
jgi:imidazolonepropionase-like amidohydrolase